MSQGGAGVLGQQAVDNMETNPVHANSYPVVSCPEGHSWHMKPDGAQWTQGERGDVGPPRTTGLQELLKIQFTVGQMVNPEMTWQRRAC